MPFSASRCCIAIAIAVSLGLAARPAMAQQPATRYEIRLPEQSLADSLRALGKAAHVNIVFEPDAVQGKRAPMLDGRYTAAEALERLLADSGLDLRSTAGGSFAIEPPRAMPAPTREQVTADAASPRTAAFTFDPLLVIGKAEGFSATRMPTALKDVPQSVSIITQDTLQEQNARSLDQALGWATGITLARATSTRNKFISRGFDVGTYHVDGGAALGISEINGAGLDLSQYDRIEVLRGADALFGGGGDPGASVNLTRKRPLADPMANITLSAGSWNNYRAEADLSDRITADGRLRGRMVAVREDQAYHYDNAGRKMSKLYAVFDYDASDSTRLTLGGSREDSSRISVEKGLPRYSDGADPHLPRDTGLTFPWARIRANISEGFAQVEQGLGERWRFKAGATKLRTEETGIYPEISAAINPVTNRLSGFPSAQDTRTETDQTSFDVNLTGSFDWNGRAQELVLGADAVRMDYQTHLESLTVTGPLINPFDFDPGLYPRPIASPFAFSTLLDVRTRQHGVYAAIKLRPAARWAVTLGARNNFTRTESRLALRFGPFPLANIALHSGDGGVLTPYGGMVYELNDRYSLYASYAQVFNANSTTMANGSPLGPSRGTNLEAGLKGAWHDGRLNGSVALFKIDQDNVGVTDPRHASIPGTACCVIPVTQRSKGVEAELSGLLAPGWQLSAGYTFDINRRYDGALLSTQTPRHLFKLWTTYQLPGNASDWSIGGGVTAQTENYTANTACAAFDPVTGACIGNEVPFRAVQGFYSVTTLRVEYRLADHWNLALNVDNLFDRRYYQTISNPSAGNWYGAPRNWMLTLRGQF